MEAEIRRIVRELLPQIVREELRRMISENSEPEAPDARAHEWTGGYGVATPYKVPGEPERENWEGVKKVCPCCKKLGDVLAEFGLRIARGKEGPQSFCRDCRSRASTKTYRKFARKTAAQVRAGRGS